VLVHGTFVDHTSWGLVVPFLIERCTVYAVDRRGREASGDSEQYSVEVDAQDVVAVVDSVGSPVSLFGHSLGGLVALEAALDTDEVERLILYEPSTGGNARPGIIERLEEMLRQDDREGLLITALREVAGMSGDQIEQLRNLPTWLAGLAAAHTVPRELRAAAGYRFNASRFARLDTPTLLLRGEFDPAGWVEGSITAVGNALPNARLRTLAGQAHVAQMTAPSLLADEVLGFTAV
jgi:pimeloyl-ACP methyl ester carboxylesterase